MRVNVRHEAATGEPGQPDAQPERTCTWVVGEDGETIDTRYLAPGEDTYFDFGAQETSETAEAKPPIGGASGTKVTDHTSAAAARAGEEPGSRRAEEPPA